MHKILLIIKREYLTRVRKKSFLVMTILGPLLMAAIVIVPIYLATKGTELKSVAVIDQTGIFFGKFKDNELRIIDKIDFKDGKTKEVAAVLKNLGITSRILMAFAAAEKDARIASRNIAKAENIMTAQLNIVDMLNNKYLLMSKDSLKYLEEKYTEDKK